MKEFLVEEFLKDFNKFLDEKIEEKKKKVEEIEKMPREERTS